MQHRVTIWLDVEDLFHYVIGNKRFSGIQRLTFELYTALQQQAVGGMPIRFVRIDPETDTFRTVDWQQVHDLCHALTLSSARQEEAPGGGAPPSRLIRRLWRGVASRVQDGLTDEARAHFLRFRTLQGAALRAALQLGREARRMTGDARQQPGTSAMATDAQDAGPTHPAGAALLDVARPGDWLLALGASWHRVDYGQLLERQRRDGGLRTGMLFYDLIPLRRPEWCNRSLTEAVRAWLNGALPSLDAMFAISVSTADDLAAYLREQGMASDCTVRPIPIGTGFPASAESVRQEGEQVAAHALPPPGSYVLMVSTIEARKNHALMFQVWRRLARELPPEQVPTLVFAGRVGWLIDDLMQQIADTDYLNGKLQLIESPSDAMLMRLYEGCLFTVMPSMFEGWGLPVSESLAVGKPCLAANVTALPEAGGRLARYLDPYDLNDAYDKVLAILNDRPGLAA